MITADFVDYIFGSCNRDKEARAILRRADIESFEWRSWPIIYPFLKNLEDDSQRECFIIIASSIAKSGFSKNGNISLGNAYRLLADDRNKNEFSSRFLRLLATESLFELLDILRPSLAYISSKGILLDYVSTLDELLTFRFENRRHAIKLKWAHQYIGNKEKEGE